MPETTKDTGRKIVNKDVINSARLETFRELSRRLNQKGFGTLASKHEILGVITEEYHELIHAIESNVPLEQVQKELRDIAVGCIFGDACIMNETVDW